MAQTSQELVVQENNVSKSKEDIMRGRRDCKKKIVEWLEESRPLINERREKLVGWHQRHFLLKMGIPVGDGTLDENEVATEIRQWFVAKYWGVVAFVEYGLDKEGSWVVRLRKC